MNGMEGFWFVRLAMARRAMPTHALTPAVVTTKCAGGYGKCI